VGRSAIWSAAGFYTWSVIFSFIYISNFPKTIANKSNPTLFAGDTSIIITNPTATEFTKIINQILFGINRWFQSNLLFLNYDKTYFMQF